MNNRERKEIFALDNVLVSYSGPLKDEVLFEGKLSIIEESHGLEIEWLPLKLKTSDTKNSSPDVDSLEWEDVTSSVGYKANHNDSIDAVEIKSVNVPKPVKFDLADLNSFKKTEVSDSTRTVVTFLLKDGTNVPAFQFQNNEFGKFCAALDNYTHFRRSTREKNLYLVVDPKVEALEKSFSELDLFSESKPHILNVFHDPYNTALGGFSKVTNYLLEHVIYGNGTGSQAHDTSLTDMLTENILNIKIDALEEPGYELITCIELPPRPEVQREDPVTLEEWNSFVDPEGRIPNFDALKQRIFKGGLVHSVRSEAWKYLLGFYNPDSTSKEKGTIKKKKDEDYFRMKLQWMSIDADQESRFSALRERKSLIGKDVSRTDRTHPFYEGENNPNLQMLQDILMTYCMYNFDLGYVQGMSDLLSPILVVMQNELEAFWCFAGWLDKIGVNFELEQQGMKNQLQDLHRLLHFVDSQLLSYLEKHESGNLYFAFRWLLILFKRDFKFMEIMRLWEVLWTGLPCKNFHLLICIAILDSEKMTIMENEYGLSEILKHINEMSYKINLDDALSKAEAIYLQIKNSRYQSDIVQSILGIEPTTPPLPPPPPPSMPKVTKPVVKPIKPPGFAVPVNREDTSERTSNTSENTSENIEEYVDLEQHYRLQFDLFS